MRPEASVRARLLALMRLVAHGEARIEPAAAQAPDRCIIAGNGCEAAVDAASVEAALRGGLVAKTGHGGIALTAAGRGWLKRALCDADDPFPSQHGTRVVTEREIGGERIPVRINTAESPLSGLLRLKDRSGASFLTRDAFDAGERLRADFERGHLQPRVTANWEAAVASGGRRSGGSGIADLTDAALAARLRVERALAAVGPELSGVLIDACCFLKGLEAIERERQWPVRSAKLMLRTALEILARHYAPPARGRAEARHWGADDYRPSLTDGS